MCTGSLELQIYNPILYIEIVIKKRQKLDPGRLLGVIYVELEQDVFSGARGTWKISYPEKKG